MRFFSSLLAIVLSAGCATTEPAAPEFGIKEDWSGSGIRRYAVRAPVIPVNKRYGELTAEQKAVIFNWYENLGPADEPPFPAEGLKSLHEAVRQGYNRAAVQGELLLLASVNSGGDVDSVKIFRTPSAAMATYVSSVLMLTKFKPAICGGVPCRMEYPFLYAFEVR